MTEEEEEEETAAPQPKEEIPSEKVDQKEEEEGMSLSMRHSTYIYIFPNYKIYELNLKEL